MRKLLKQFYQFQLRDLNSLITLIKLRYNLLLIAFATVTFQPFVFEARRLLQYLACNIRYLLINRKDFVFHGELTLYYPCKLVCHKRNPPE